MVQSLLIFLILTILFSTAAAAEKYYVPYFHSPPFTIHREGKQPDGILIKAIARILDESNIPYKFNQFSSKGFYRMLDIGERAQLGITDKRRVEIGKKLHFGDRVVNLTLDLHWREESPPITELNDLSNKKLVLLHGLVYGGVVDRLKEITPPPKFTEARNRVLAAKIFRSRRSDYIMRYNLVSEGGPSTASQLSRNLQTKKLHNLEMFLFVHKNVKNGEQILQRLNHSLNELKSSGKLKDIISFK